MFINQKRMWTNNDVSVTDNIHFRVVAAEFNMGAAHAAKPEVVSSLVQYAVSRAFQRQCWGFQVVPTKAQSMIFCYH